MNTVKLSDGTKIGRNTFDARVFRAKKVMKENFIHNHGYLYCIECGKNQNGCERIAASHLISVDECVKSGQSEIAYDLKNMLPMGQKCHREFENLSKIQRYARYLAEKEK